MHKFQRHIVKGACRGSLLTELEYEKEILLRMLRTETPPSALTLKLLSPEVLSSARSRWKTNSVLHLRVFVSFLNQNKTDSPEG